MLQHVDGKDVYVVDFDTMPKLPITGLGIERIYAEALTDAIVRGIVTEPGKYGIEIQWHLNRTDRYDIYKINE